MKKNDIYTVEIIDLSHEGYGVTKVNDFVVFVENTLPNEVVEIKIVKVLKRYAFGKVINFLSKSKDRVEIIDNIGYRNGTMPLQHMSYPLQLKFKKKIVIDTLSKVMDLENIKINDTIGMENPWGYRNKGQIPVQEINGLLETGFYKRNSHDLIPVENFHIQDKEIDEIVLKVRNILREHSIRAYDETNHSGDIRYVIVRKGHYTNEFMIILVTRELMFNHKDGVIKDIMSLPFNIVSLVQNINDKKTNVIMGNKSIVLFGNDYYMDHLLDKTFKISSHSFYQVNSIQTEKLYEKALEYASLGENDVVLDAYCGIGTIGILASDKAKKVYGVEVIEDAIKMAHENLKLNNVTNAEYVAGKAEDVIKTWAKESIKFDVVIVDPPRKGLDSSFIDTVGEIQPKRIVYVSCNPITLARDLKLFENKGYGIEEVTPVDMFPQTAHVETIVLMSRAGV